jgi:hydrogenase large subunit
MQIKKLIEKIEGEAELDFLFKDKKIDDVKIKFGLYRGIEKILIGKPAMDALVITPRVCGICNHAHLIASVRALEDGYKRVGVQVKLPPKANDIREFTLSCELIQNHIKWFYLTILPQLEKLIGKSTEENYALKASSFSSTITKALAIFAGQWPHSSYTVPFGVTCDPTFVDIIQAENLLDESIRFFEQVTIGMELDRFLSMESVTDLPQINGDFGRFLYLLNSSGMAEIGKSYDKFIVFGECLCFKIGKSKPTKVSNIDVSFVKESSQPNSMARAVKYKNSQYEVGSLARGMISKEPIIKSLHKRYKDSILIRIFARVYEIGLLLDYSKKLLQKIEIDSPSYPIENIPKLDNFDGIGVVEAARGSLIHKTTVRDGMIENYEIIVPTQWNLSQGDSKKKGVAIKAMIGSSSIDEASFIFRSFDVCSVCTTQ